MPPGLSRIDLSVNYEWMPDEWAVFRGIIADEMKMFNLVGLGGKKKWSPTGVFRLIANDVWLYYYPGYVKMSSVTLTQVLDCGIISDATEMESATCTCSTHDELQSYFYDNPRLLQIFRLQLQSATNDVRFRSLCKIIETLEGILNHSEPHQSTPFETPSVPGLSSLMFQEDDWTKRLCNSIPYCLKSVEKVKYSSREGTRFDLLQHQYSSTFVTGHYLFQGAPDAIISYKRKKQSNPLEFVDVEGDDSVMMIQDETTYSSSSSSSSEDNIIEANRVTMQFHKGVVLPQKLGQLIASMHTWAIAKVIRRIVKGKRPDDVTVRGEWF